MNMPLITYIVPTGLFSNCILLSTNILSLRDSQPEADWILVEYLVSYWPKSA